ncbi:MAG: S9 family peptidase [Bdellovibrio sp.]|nr:S9 family peptidase [Bdellovibrio sp.]
MQTPAAPKKAKQFNNHGDLRTDNYFWLRDKEDPQAMAYLNAENDYFQNHMKPLEKLKNKLFKEMKSRIKENDSSVPYLDGDYYYWSQFKKGFQYSFEMRKLKKGGGAVVYLDCNKLAAGKKYFSLGGSELAADENMLAYAVDFDGSEKYSIHFRNIKTGLDTKEVIPNCSGSFKWAKDSQTLFYVAIDDNLRPYRVCRHKLGDDIKNDKVVFEESDSQYFIHLYQGLSQDFIYLYTGGKITTEIWYLKSDDSSGQFKCFEARKEGIEYRVLDRHGDFWVRTNYKALNFQIMKVSSKSTAKRNWKTILKASGQILREGFLLFEDYLVVSEKANGLPQIRIKDLNSNSEHVISFPDKAYDVSIAGGNAIFTAQNIRLSYSSPVTPPSVLDYDIQKKKFKTLKIKKVKGHKKSDYVCERVFVKSHDQVKVPLTIVYKKGLKKNGTAPGYLYGYGSYGASMPDAFPGRRDLFRLIDRGFVYALAHPRGGSEMGRSWYEDGKFLKKKNTFQDFIACGDYLVKNKFVSKAKLAACGGSAGGMLMGASINMRPDLFSVVAAHVPFVDVINTMLDKDLLLTQVEFKEWGNPEEKKYYNYIKSYSPYDNVEAKAYPHLFVTCGLNDPRVTYWEPAKWVAKLRELKTDAHTILFKTNMGAGHFGVSGRFDHLWEQAEEYAFVLNKFGIKK